MKKIRKNTGVRVLRELIRRYFEDNVARASAELAYYLLFSVFPLLIFLNAVLSTLNLSADDVFRVFNGVLPTDVADIFNGYLLYLNQTDAQAMLYAGLALTIYMVARALRSLMRSVARAYRNESKSAASFWLSVAISVFLLLFIFVFFVALVLSGNLLDKISGYISLSPQFIQVLNLFSYILAPATLFILLALFYRLAAGRRYSLATALPGSAFVLVIWFVATWLFSYYVSNMGRYSLLYGSLGAIIVLMLWLYLTGIVLILGGELNCILADIIKEKRQKSGT